MLTCSEPDGSPPSEYLWYRDGALMPLEPKRNRAFSNSSYSLNPKTGELVRMGGLKRAGHRYGTPEGGGGTNSRVSWALGSRDIKGRCLASRQDRVVFCLQVFDPVSASDTGEYSCQAQNGYGTPVMSAAVRMEAGACGQGRAVGRGSFLLRGPCGWHHE